MVYIDLKIIINKMKSFGKERLIWYILITLILGIIAILFKILSIS